MESDEPIWRERALRDAVLAGDSDAWRVLYDACFAPVFAYVHCRSGRRMEVTEDVVQDTWMTAVRQIGKFNPERGRFESWLRGIADNVLRNHLRRAGRARLLPWLFARERPSTETGAPATATDEPGISDQIARTLTELPSRYQAVIRAKYQEDLPVVEIAARWGETPKAVESLLSRARTAFREAFRRLESTS